MRMIEQTIGHYETQDVELGRVYRWLPGSVTLECEECGKRSTHTKSTLIRSSITCECGKDDTATIREKLIFELLEETQDLHPWRNQTRSEDTGIPF
jgi:hypothetical protein